MKFLAGFIFNIFWILYNLIPMSIDLGRVCMKENKYPWQMSDDDLVDKLEKID